MPAALDVDDLGDAGVLQLLLVGGVGDRPRHRVVALAGDDQQRPAVGVLSVDLHLGPRVEVGGGRLEDRRAGAGDRIGLVERLGLRLVDGVGERVAELVVGQGDGAVAVGGVREDRLRRAQRADRQRQDPAERGGRDRHRRARQPAPGDDLGEQAAERVPDHDRLGVEAPGVCGHVVGDLADGLVGEDLRMGLGLVDRVGVVGPTGGDRRVAGGGEVVGPAVPAAGQEPEAVDEDDGFAARGVGAVDLLGDREWRGRGHDRTLRIARRRRQRTSGAGCAKMWSHMASAGLLDITIVAPAAQERARLVRRARLLAWLGVAWHGVEAAVAVGAGLAAGSIALIGFGADSLVEAAAGLLVLWRFAGARALAGGDEPAASWGGIGLAAVTLATMPPLARAKERVAVALGSPAGASESRQTLLCAYLSAALLAGLGLNALLGWWWADPVTALLLAGVAAREARAAWRGDACCTAMPGLSW